MCMSLNIQCSYKLFTTYLYFFSIISKIVEFLQRWNDVKKKKKERNETNKFQHQTLRKNYM